MINLQKGQKISLAKVGEDGLKNILVGLGWDPAKKGLFGGHCDIDCDASAVILGKGDKYKGCVYYGNRSQFNVIHHGDNLTGAGVGDDEQITIKLNSLDADVEKIVFVVNIYACTSRKQDFGMIDNAYIRFENQDTGEELCRYNLSDDYKGKTAMIFGELYKHNDEWKFNAMGQGTYDTSVSELTKRYK